MFWYAPAENIGRTKSPNWPRVLSDVINDERSGNTLRERSIHALNLIHGSDLKAALDARFYSRDKRQMKRVGN